MAFFSLESTRFKSWLVGNMKIWGFAPAVVVWLLATVLVVKFNPEANMNLVGYCLIAAIVSSMIFTVAQENEKPMVIYTLYLALPFILLIGHAMGKFNLDFMTTGVVVYLWIDVVISLGIGGVIGYYAYTNAYDIWHNIFHFRRNLTEMLASEYSMAYMRFVEAFIYTFIGLAAFAPIFS